ncbi:Transcription factor tau subunit sfc1 [Lecanosticta acicola]|uniref:Transcription factor tau subunit sfc1 n=1 Tax=Lecanosticta acicola TaxID=111012 RepID=A0AAI8YSP7_9PEZI|nr:Transcription factor tau subunit sfc1 [Lecanosticta acicola]
METHDIPISRVVSIEHPSIVRTCHVGLKSLGGEAQLKHVLEHHVGDSKLHGKQNHLPEPVAGVSLRPNDPLAKKLSSTGIESRNVLVKVTVPKRTGRKRKRGSLEPFAESAPPETPNNCITAPELLQRLRENEGKYEVEPVAMLRETHRFRTLPDFQVRNADLPIMRELRDHAMTPDYDKLKHFSVDMSVDAIPTAFPGPPSFTSIDMPHKYEYQQASSVIYVPDESGQIITKNLSAPPKRLTWGLPPDIGEVPQAAPFEIPTRSPSGEMLPRAVQELEKILKDRPLITKRVALNALPPISESIFKEATQFVGYSFKAGPWRDSLIKYGVDPRKDPKYRFYQTLMFQVDHVAFNKDKSKLGTPTRTGSTWARPLRHKKDDPNTHIFDGKSITANGKTWQICDVTDPVLHALWHTPNIRAECDVYQYGWYHNGTVAKGRTIMRDMMRFLFAGEPTPLDEYKKIAQKVPDQLTPNNLEAAMLAGKEHGARIGQMCTEIRGIVKGGETVKGKKIYWGRKSGKVDRDGNMLENVEEAREAGAEAGEDEYGETAGLDEEQDMGEGDFERDDEVNAELLASQSHTGRQSGEQEEEAEGDRLDYEEAGDDEDILDPQLRSSHPRDRSGTNEETRPPNGSAAPSSGEQHLDAEDEGNDVQIRSHA